MASILHAREAEIKFASSISIDTTGNIYADFSGGTAVEAVIKDVSITAPAGEVEKIDLHGEDANGFQNAIIERKPYGMAELSGTVIVQGDEVIESFIFPTATATTDSYSRYQLGKGTRKTPAIVLQLTDGTDIVNVAMDQCEVTTLELKSTGADGHFEYDFTAKCLAKNFYWEVLD